MFDEWKVCVQTNCTMYRDIKTEKIDCVMLISYVGLYKTFMKKKSQNCSD